MDTYKRLAHLFKVLAHPVRLHILYALQNGDQYVDHLGLALGRRQANISQHLAVLRQAGLVTACREGNRMRYCLPSKEVIQLLSSLNTVPRQAPVPESQTVWVRCHCPRCQQLRAQAMRIAVLVTASDCGHRLLITVAWADEGQICLSIAGSCTAALNLGEALPPLDLADELSKPLNETRVYTLAPDYLCRASCLVPGALMETLQVVAGLAVPSASYITFTSDTSPPHFKEHIMIQAKT
ncbi:MAG: ArsR/SmtB family transcription factor [Anaerolineae bacterium]